MRKCTYLLVMLFLESKQIGDLFKKQGQGWIPQAEVSVNSKLFSCLRCLFITVHSFKIRFFILKVIRYIVIKNFHKCSVQDYKFSLTPLPILNFFLKFMQSSIATRYRYKCITRVPPSF